MFACKPQVPDEYIQPDELEDILYDYHLADAMAEENDESGDQEYNKALYRAAVLKKHGITKAELDSTLVYYTRHSDRLYKIYDNLAKRFSDDALSLGASASDVNRFGTMSSEGDTTNVWTGAPAALLTAEAPYNVMSFDVTADTTYRKGDRMILSFNVDFILKEGSKDGVAMLAVEFKNDSVASNFVRMTSNKDYSVTVSDADRNGIKSIRGFFYLGNGSSLDSDMRSNSLKLMALTNIRLIRFHNNDTTSVSSNKAKNAQKADSLSSEKTDSAANKPSLSTDNKPSADKSKQGKPLMMNDVAPVKQVADPKKMPSNTAKPKRQLTR